MKKMETVAVKKEKETSIENGKMIKTINILNKNSLFLVAFLMSVLMIGSTVYAADANTLWTSIGDLIKVWVSRLGGLVMFVGMVNFGLGWKNDDPSQKTQGTQTAIAGGIVMAAALMVGNFIA